MVIKCEKCGEDLTVSCCNRFEKNIVGKIQCPHCQKIQKRYISEADLLLYYGVSETYYVVLSYVTMKALDHFGIKWFVAIGFGALLIGSYFVFKKLAEAIYINGYGKKDSMNVTQDEDKDYIQRNLTWQSLLFYAIAITYFTGTQFSNFFLFALILANALTYLKYYLAKRREKTK